MKTRILNSVAFLFLATAISSCNSTEDGALEKPEDNRQEFLNDMEEFRRDAEIKIQETDERIVELENQIGDGAEEADLIIGEKIIELKARNEKLRMELDEIDSKSEVAWKKFKEDFNTEMQKLSESLDDLTIDKKK